MIDLNNHHFFDNSLFYTLIIFSYLLFILRIFLKSFIRPKMGPQAFGKNNTNKSLIHFVSSEEKPKNLKFWYMWLDVFALLYWWNLTEWILLILWGNSVTLCRSSCVVIWSERAEDVFMVAVLHCRLLWKLDTCLEKTTNLSKLCEDCIL